ncbi:uncharacterized protein LOC120081651 [Benincasa hispida]|uniref:uncharacterized protein LOC120081651 n=1 Tax=Benincasa hispida TaxID=102211 RepID=UPI001901DF09|nr:uncharacterized protein LOC120081651 [Benincasa hispida]
MTPNHTCSIEVLNHDHSYGKAWRARETAFALAKGTLEESYVVLHAYCEALKIENPRTVFEIELEESKYFKYVFMVLGASLRGFKSCRPVIIIDGTHLKGKYKGTIIVGVAIDGNNQLYPLAYAIVDSENDRALKWFMTNLKAAIGECPNLVFISDRGQSIANVIDIVFLNSYHELCTFHLKRNVENYFKDKVVRKLFHDAYRAYRESEFKRHWVQIVNYKNGSLATYLEDASIQWWARCYQFGNRYDNMTSNISKCFNAITKEVRVLPATSLLEYIRGMLQGWSHERRTMWSNSTSTHLVYAEEIMSLECEKARRCRVNPIDYYRFHVKDGGIDGIALTLENVVTSNCSVWRFRVRMLLLQLERAILIHLLYAADCIVM